jgi:hypothetical protein
MPVQEEEASSDGEPDVKVVLNKAAIVNEIARLAGDLIDRVEMIKE